MSTCELPVDMQHVVVGFLFRVSSSATLLRVVARAKTQKHVRT